MRRSLGALRSLGPQHIRNLKIYRTKRLYKWGIFLTITIVIVLVCVSLPFVIIHESKKPLLLSLISVIITLLLITIGLSEWFRRKSMERKRFSQASWTTQRLHTVNSYYAPTVISETSTNVSSKSSWLHWSPKKTPLPSTPRETEI